jgi:hypothetical protein
MPLTMERRRASRRAPASDEPLSRVRFRAGSHATVIDLSNSGALVEGVARLLPGTHVDVHVFAAEGRSLVRSRVVRAYVSHLEAELIRYRGALAFDRTIDAAPAGYSLPDVLAVPQTAEGNGYPRQQPEAARRAAEYEFASGG